MRVIGSVDKDDQRVDQSFVDCAHSDELASDIDSEFLSEIVYLPISDACGIMW